MCAFLCTLFLHSSAVLFLISHPHSPMLSIFLCILGKISQMYMLWSGKNLGFSSFLKWKQKQRKETNPLENSQWLWAGKWECQFAHSAYDWNKAPDVDFQQHWSPPTAAFCFHPCKFFYVQSPSLRDWGGARPEYLVVRLIFQRMED